MITIIHCHTSMKIIAILLIHIFCFIETNTFKEESKEFSEESGSNISFEIQATNEKSIESDESTENSISNEVSKSGVIDNDQVFCAWEDVDARDKMATKLGTEICRFSMVRLPTSYGSYIVNKLMNFSTVS